MRSDLDSSIRFWKQAIKLDPESGAPYNDIGAYMIDMGALEGAIPWLILGRVQERRGNWIGALEFVKGSLRCRPNYVPALKALSRIRGRLN